MSGSPIQLRGKSGGVVFDGTQSPGGGSQPLIAAYSGNLVAIADNDGEALGWDSLDSGTELFDRSNPLLPVFLAAGLYAFNAQVVCSTALTTGGLAFMSLAAASGNFPVSAPYPSNGVGLPLIVLAAAGELVELQVDNMDGAASRSYQLTETTVLKLA